MSELVRNPEDGFSHDGAHILQVKDTPEPEPDPLAEQPGSTPSPSTDEKPAGACKCPPQAACKCEQAALPLTRQYVKSLLEHLHGQVSINSRRNKVRI